MKRTRPSDLAGRLVRALLPTSLVVAVIVAYLMMLPATWFDALLQNSSLGTLCVTGAGGTLWRGEGTLQALQPNGEVATLAPITWEISLAELLTLRLHLVVHSAQTGAPVLDTTLRPGSTQIQTARLSLPAALLGVLSPTFRAADLSGQIDLQANDVHVAAGHATGSAQALWSAAGSSLTRIRPLGNYQLGVNGQGGGLDLRLTTLGGPLTLAGSGKWSPGQNLAYNITATPIAAASKDLAPLLGMLGREITPGTYQLTLARGMGAVTR